MKNSVMLLFCLTLVTATTVAQHRGAKIEVEYNNLDGKMQLLCKNDNQIAGFFTIQIKLQDPQNISTPSVVNRVVTPGSVIETYTPQNPQKAYGLGRYSYSFIRGKITAKHNQNTVYRLPVSQYKSVEVLPLSFLRETYAGEKRPEDWRSFQFKLSKGDTVYAARRGRVVEIVDNMEPVSNDGHVSYTSYANYIIIEHLDGTLSHYEVLEKGSAMVKLGDVVFPSTPIALAGTYNEIDYQSRFYVFYAALNTDKTAQHPFKYSYIDPLFITTRGTVKLVDYEEYQPVVTDKLIEAEMTKSEIAKMRR